VNDYVLSADAELDLDEIWEYISADNLDAADRWIGKSFDAFEILGKTPGIGHRREDLTHFPVLFWPVGAYLIIYHAEPTPVEIVAETLRSRDVPAFLRGAFDRRSSMLRKREADR
jgi:plasmid stabilization system protein ParE